MSKEELKVLEELRRLELFLCVPKTLKIKDYQSMPEECR